MGKDRMEVCSEVHPELYQEGDPYWFQLFALCAKANRWGPKTKILRLGTCLTGRAFSMYQGLVAKGDYVVEDEEAELSANVKFEGLVAALQEALNGCDSATAARREFNLRKLRKGESPQMFAYELERLASVAFPASDGYSTKAKKDLVRAKFVEGLPDSMKGTIVLLEGKSFEEVVRLLSQWAAQMGWTSGADGHADDHKPKTLALSEAPQRSGADELADLVRTGRELLAACANSMDQMNRIHQNMMNGASSLGQRGNMELPQGQGRVRQTGRNARGCEPPRGGRGPANRVGQGGRGSSEFRGYCFSCGNWGHRAINCLRKQPLN